MNVQRATIVAVVLFAIVYLAIAVGGASRNRSQPPQSAATPVAIGFDPSAWTPSFAKVAPRAGTLVVPAGGNLAIPVPASGERFLIAHFACVQCSGGPAVLNVAHTGADGKNHPPDTIGAGGAVTIAVPQGSAPIVLVCASFNPCVVTGP